jgi:hypothetical protein
MSDGVERITIQLRPPKGNFPGKIAIGYYVVNPDNDVVLCDESGKPIDGMKEHLEPGGLDARLIASRMLRRRQSASGPSGFSDRLAYPKLRY